MLLSMVRNEMLWAFQVMSVILSLAYLRALSPDVACKSLLCTALLLYWGAAAAVLLSARKLTCVRGMTESAQAIERILVWCLVSCRWSQ